jgi:hypothetical protein
MGRRARRAALAVVLAALAGCHQPAVQQKQPPDPLLISKKPVEGTPRGPDGDLSARVQPPPPPPLSAGDFAQSPPPLRLGPEPAGDVKKAAGP